MRVPADGQDGTPAGIRRRSARTGRNGGAFDARRRGRIINVSSIGGKYSEPLGAWYHATKFAVEGLSDSLRLDLKPFGISVSIIEPSSTLTEWGRIAAEGLEATSGSGPYAPHARLMAGALRSTERPATSMRPDVIAGAILDAATLARPRTRYPVGSGARAILALRRVLPDRLYDAAIMAVLKRVATG